MVAIGQLVSIKLPEFLVAHFPTHFTFYIPINIPASSCFATPSAFIPSTLYVPTVYQFLGCLAYSLMRSVYPIFEFTLKNAYFCSKFGVVAGKRKELRLVMACPSPVPSEVFGVFVTTRYLVLFIWVDEIYSYFTQFSLIISSIPCLFLLYLS